MLDQSVLAELAPTGVLRAGVNLSNFLLVTGRTASGDPEGVSPSMAAAVAERLGVPVQYVTYPRPDALADAAGTGAWDIGLIGAEPARAEKIAFSAAYAEIESTYMVPPGSPISSMAEIDRPGIRISVARGSAYVLWLVRNIKHAELVHSASIDASFQRFRDEGLEVLAGLRPRLITDVTAMAGATILPGGFSSVQQAVGTARANRAGAAFLAEFVEEAKRDGLVARLIERFGVRGLTVAPARATHDG
jgi:polar amino acid transport system substrate-binding protein